MISIHNFSVNKLAIGVLFSTLLYGCQSRTLVADPALSGKTTTVSIAVVPYEVSFTGSGREHMTEEFLTDQAAVKAEAFQQDLVSKISRRVARRTGRNISIQAPQETNARLRDMGLTLSVVQQKSPGELIDVFGVDAIVMGNVRLNSNYRNMGLGKRAEARLASFVPNWYDVAVRLSVVNKSGVLVYGDFDDGTRRNCQTLDSVNDRVAIANNRMSRRLPFFR